MKSFLGYAEFSRPKRRVAPRKTFLDVLAGLVNLFGEMNRELATQGA